jgi:hypothetical protein
VSQFANVDDENEPFKEDPQLMPRSEAQKSGL